MMYKKPEPKPEPVYEGYKREEPKLAYDYLKKSKKTVKYAPVHQYAPKPEPVYAPEPEYVEPEYVEPEYVDEAMEYVDDEYAEDVYDDDTYAEDEYVESCDVHYEEPEYEEPKEVKKYSIMDRALSYAHGNKYGRGDYKGSYSRAHLPGKGRTYERQVYKSHAEAAKAHGGYAHQTPGYEQYPQGYGHQQQGYGYKP